MDAKRGACPEGDKPVRRGPRVVRARARPTGMSDPRFEWAFEPAPRSYWRGEGCEHLREVGYVLVVFGLWLSAVWLVGALPRG